MAPSLVSLPVRRACATVSLYASGLVASLFTGGRLLTRLRVTLGWPQPIWVRSVGEAERDDCGNVIAVYGALQDITELVHARQQAEKLNQRLYETLEHISDAFLTLDSNWCYIYLNAQAERLLNKKRQQLIGVNIWQAFPDARGTAFEEHFSNTMRNKITSRFTEFYPPLNTWFEVSVYPASDGLAIYFRDVTERIEMENRLRQAQKMEAIGHLTGGIAHDYNNLLTVIISNTELLTEQLPKHSEQYKSADLSLAAAQKAAGLTQHLLAFGQRQTLKPEQLSLHSLLDNAGSLLRHITPQNISLSTQIRCQSVMLHLDKTRFEMALLNIAINAREAMPDGGTLCLTASLASAELVRQHALDESRQYINITLSDTGPGMSDEVKRRAFEPFFTTKAMAQGYGLGLSMVYGFTLQSGGIACINAPRSEEDELKNDSHTGCSVSLILPVSSHHTTLQNHDEHVSHSGATNRLLLVEDDALLQQHLVLILSKAGYQVTTADSADEAMAMLQAQRGHQRNEDDDKRNCDEKRRCRC